MAAISELDGARFGVRVAKAAPDSAEDWGRALEFCARHGVQLLIARIDATRGALAQRLEDDGARLCDVLLQFRCTRLGGVAAAPAGFVIRSCAPAQAAAVRELAREVFRGYTSHYHADARLDRTACDEVYADWAWRACSERTAAEEVLVAEENAKLLGFAALRMSSAGEADGRLFGVAPGARGRGIQRALLQRFLAWGAARGAASAIYQTQLGNLAAQRSVVRAGFEPDCAFLTFHHWMPHPAP
ncbi:MAG: GNAT family N-acetyltransferase [Betaproteobacteria bacterium]|nr:MAG: GNAT family N-acetyltransferase [Betaproteobacteria bacterium]